ncbi:hypothetical protein CR513_44642, partial [Mucuna pruriens]
MDDTLQVTHDGTTYVMRMRMRVRYLKTKVNHLVGQCKIFENKELIIKKMIKIKMKITLKATTSGEECGESESSNSLDLEEENLSLIVKKFGKFLKQKNINKKSTQRKPFKKNE